MFEGGGGGGGGECVGKLDAGSLAAFFCVVDPGVEKRLFAPLVIAQKCLRREQRNVKHVRRLDQQLEGGEEEEDEEEEEEEEGEGEEEELIEGMVASYMVGERDEG